MIQIQPFGGAYPVIPPHLLPSNAAQYARDCDVRQGELRPMAKPRPALSNLPAGTKGVFSDKGLTFLTSQSPMRAALSPTIDDLYSRVYYTNADGFRVSRWTDTYHDGRAVQSWMVGVPTPKAKLVVEKQRKNRWPGYPGATPKARFFFESSGQRYGETDVALSVKSGSPAFAAYTFNAGVNLADVVEQSAKSSLVKVGLTVRCSAIFLAAAKTVTDSLGMERSFGAGWNTAPLGFDVTISAVGATIRDLSSGTSFDLLSTELTKLRLSTGDEVIIDYTGASTGATAVPPTATPAVEFWIENTDGTRLATVYSTNSSFSFGGSPVAGGMTLSITPTGATTYELNLSFGVMETRAYVYTMVNDWSEESAPSDPVLVDVTYLDDVVLRVDYDECVAQLQGYRSLDHIQFYCAANNTSYLAVKTAPSSSGTVADLYRALLWREPDAAGLAFWESEYANGASLASIAASMQASNEYRNPEPWLIIEDIYVELLDREPDDEGLTYWVGEFNKGLSIPEIIWSFLRSSEFIAAHPTRPTITQYYQMFVGRDPDPAGLAYWQAKISANPFEEAVMLFALLSSAEYKALRISAHLTTMLTVIYGRAPTTAELNSALAMFNNGQSLNNIAYVIVSSLGDSGTGHVDEGDDRYSGWTLTSAAWTAPFPDLKMLTPLPNGVFAAARGRTVYFSEPYRPYAWPDVYAQTLPFDIVGMRAFEGQLLVVTTGVPFVISGTHPEGMTQQRIASNSAAVSEWAIAEVSGRPAYASRDGIVLIEGMQASLGFSRQIWTPELWRQKYGSRLDTLKLVSHNDRLLGLFDTGDGFMLHYNEDSPHMVEISASGGYPFSIPGNPAVYLAKPSGVVAMFYAGDDYFQMSRIYAELLDREPDDEGLDYWSNMLDGGLSLVDVIWSFLQSEEFREENPTNPTVTGYYTAFLGRSPTSDESSYWTARIAADPREEAVLIASLLGSSEYEATLIPADSPSPYVWHSKEFTLPAPVSFSACKAVMNGSASISIYGDGELIVEESVETNGLEERYFRLPQSGRYLRFSVKIEGAAQVRSVKVARSFAEMRNA